MEKGIPQNPDPLPHHPDGSVDNMREQVGGGSEQMVADFDLNSSPLPPSEVVAGTSEIRTEGRIFKTLRYTATWLKEHAPSFPKTKEPLVEPLGFSLPERDPSEESEIVPFRTELVKAEFALERGLPKELSFNTFTAQVNEVFNRDGYLHVFDAPLLNRFSTESDVPDGLKASWSEALGKKRDFLQALKSAHGFDQPLAERFLSWKSASWGYNVTNDHIRGVFRDKARSHVASEYLREFGIPSDRALTPEEQQDYDARIKKLDAVILDRYVFDELARFRNAKQEFLPNRLVKGIKSLTGRFGGMSKRTKIILTTAVLSGVAIGAGFAAGPAAAALSVTGRLGRGLVSSALSQGIMKGVDRLSGLSTLEAEQATAFESLKVSNPDLVSAMTKYREIDESYAKKIKRRKRIKMGVGLGVSFLSGRMMVDGFGILDGIGGGHSVPTGAPGVGQTVADIRVPTAPAPEIPAAPLPPVSDAASAENITTGPEDNLSSQEESGIVGSETENKEASTSDVAGKEDVNVAEAETNTAEVIPGAPPEPPRDPTIIKQGGSIWRSVADQLRAKIEADPDSFGVDPESLGNPETDKLVNQLVSEQTLEILKHNGFIDAEGNTTDIGGVIAGDAVVLGDDKTIQINGDARSWTSEAVPAQEISPVVLSDVPTGADSGFGEMPPGTGIEPSSFSEVTFGDDSNLGEDPNIGMVSDKPAFEEVPSSVDVNNKPAFEEVDPYDSFEDTPSTESSAVQYDQVERPSGVLAIPADEVTVVDNVYVNQQEPVVPEEINSSSNSSRGVSAESVAEHIPTPEEIRKEFLPTAKILGLGGWETYSGFLKTNVDDFLKVVESRQAIKGPVGFEDKFYKGWRLPDTNTVVMLNEQHIKFGEAIKSLQLGRLTQDMKFEEFFRKYGKAAVAAFEARK